MTTNHILYIPLVLMLGFIIGILIGRKSVDAAEDEERRLADRREQRRQRLEATAADSADSADSAEGPAKDNASNQA